MSTNYSPGGAYPTFPLSLPEDGEIINEAVLVTGILQPIIDGIGVNAARTWTATQSFDSIVVTAGNNYDVSSRSETRTTPVRWITTSGAYTETALQVSDDATGGTTTAQIDLPHGQTLTGVTLYIDPIAHANLPAVMPSFEVRSLAVATGTASAALISKTDTSAAAAAYEVYHSIAATGAAVAIDTSANTYYINYINESGANSQINTVLKSQVSYTITRTTIGED